MPGRVLGVDFGSSSTAAVLRWPDGRVRPLLFDGSPLLSSAVHADPAAGLLTGRDAQHAARVHPDRYEPNPKRRIDEGSVFLGAETYPVVGLIAAVLRRVAEEGVRAGGGPIDELVLTHPVAWGAPRRELLLRAAALAQLPEPRLLPEPVAAAGYFVSVLGQSLPVGAGVLVYDLGAGTFDATAVRRTPRGFEVLDTVGIPDAGGLDIDAAILGHLRQAYPDRDFDGIRGRDRLLLWDNIRSAKESLSRVAGTAVPVPGLEIDAPLGRETLDSLAAPVIGRTVAASQSAMRAFGATRAPVFLVGGASRMPAVALNLHRVFGTPPVVIEQPELVVAEGSLYAVLATPETPATQPTALLGPGVPPGPGGPAHGIGAPFTAPASGTPGGPGLVPPVGAGLPAGFTVGVQPGLGGQPPQFPGQPGAPAPPVAPGQSPTPGQLTAPGRPGGTAWSGGTAGSGGTAWSGRPPVVAGRSRYALPLALGGGLLAAAILAPGLARSDGREAFAFGVRAPVSPTGVVACVLLLLLVGLTRPPSLRLGPPQLPAPRVVVALAGWLTGGLVVTVLLLAALLRAAAGWGRLDTGDPPDGTTLGALQGVGRALLIVAMALAIGLIVGALILLTRRSRDDLLALRGRRLAAAGAAGGVLLGLLLGTHLFDLDSVSGALRHDPVVFLADEGFGAGGVLAGVQHAGLFAVAAFVVVTALAFGTVAVRAVVEGVPRRAGNFATGAGYGLSAALGAYLVVRGWYELRFWAAASSDDPPGAPAIVRAGQAAWSVGWPLALALFALLGLAGGARAALDPARAARTVRGYQPFR